MARFLLFRSWALIVVSLTLFSLSCKKDSAPSGPGPATPSSFGQLMVNPAGILAGTATDVTIRLTVPGGISLVDSTVKVVRLNSSGEQIGSLAALYDDGSLAHGDEIIRDNVYSTIITLTEPAPGEVRFRAIATIKSPTPYVTSTSSDYVLPVYRSVTTQDFGVMKSTYDSSEFKIKQFLAAHPANLSAVVTQLSTWLQTKPEVASVEQGDGNSILIRFASGLNGGIIVSQQDANGHIGTRGGSGSDQQRKASKSVPLVKQTTGTVRSSGLAKVATPGAIDPNVIGNRNVLIYAPFENVFPKNERTSLEAILHNSGYEFSVTSYVNGAATVRMLSHLTDYGFVILATHGAIGKEFGTGEILDTSAAIFKSTYGAMLAGGENAQLGLWEDIVIDWGWVFKTRETIYSIRYPFIRNLVGTFPNSVILNNSCQSTMNPNLRDAFLSKGAKTYYGYNKVVNCDFCVKNADTLAKRLCTDLKNAGDAYDVANDPTWPNATFMLMGSTDLHYADSLINGDFEFGKIDGWTKSGDGRVISQLASVSPTGGNSMGIISTGLGFTTTSGSIFQTFRVTQGQTTLTVKWNFLSEEFLEYIGSTYQDYFNVVVKNASGVENVLLDRTIDALASQFGASKTDPGTLISMSPDIVFDRGGVYMTGWQTATFNLSQYAGQRITLILRAGDVGDSLYDTAILLDDITVQ